MAAREDWQKTKVGFFVLIGLLIAGGMSVYFGRLGDGLREYYHITVEYPNASGLIKGADVLMAGAQIGFVAQPPRILESMRGVSVDLKIFEDVNIPSKSSFVIGSSGLLGDRYVDVIIKEGAAESPPLEPDAVVKGSRQTGMDDLAAEGSLLISDMRETVQNINAVITRVDEEVLDEETISGVDETIKNLKETSLAFREASTDIDQVILEAKQAVEQASKAAEQAGEVVATGGETLETAKAAAEQLEATIRDARALIRQARSGNGALPMLLNDQTFAQNLRDLVTNLRKRGILWYRDEEGRGRD